MSNKKNGKILLIGAIFILLSFYFIVPIAFGFGDSFETAEIKLPGTYNDSLTSSATIAYYKVLCSDNENLYVSLNYSFGNMDLFLYNPSQEQVGSSESTGLFDSVVILCSVDGYYYIKVDWFGPFPGGSQPFTLVITLNALSGIPGFEILFAIYGFIIILGILIFQKEQKLRGSHTN